MKTTFEERETQSEPQEPNHKMAKRPATPFPSPSIEGQDRVRRFLENQKLIADTENQDGAKSMERSEYPELTQQDLQSSTR